MALCRTIHFLLGTYVEQRIIPLKKADYVKECPRCKGGHLLAKPPGKITVSDMIKKNGRIQRLKGDKQCIQKR